MIGTSVCLLPDIPLGRPHRLPGGGLLRRPDRLNPTQEQRATSQMDVTVAATDGRWS